MTNLERLLLELNNKSYYTNEEFEVYLNENKLDPWDTYSKDVDQRKLLSTVRDILESLSNNIDTFRSIETEFSTVSEAYQYLERRLQKLQNRIDALPNDDESSNGVGSDFSFIFRG